MPDIEGLGEFKGDVVHACEYKSGERFKGKKVVVVGCGNSGMELSLDLFNHNASPSIVVRSSVSPSLILLSYQVRNRSSRTQIAYFTLFHSNCLQVVLLFSVFRIILRLVIKWGCFDFGLAGSCVAKRSVWEVNVWIGDFDAAMVAPLGGGQNSIGAGVVGIGEHREVWAEKAFGRSSNVEEHKG